MIKKMETLALLAPGADVQDNHADQSLIAVDGNNGSNDTVEAGAAFEASFESIRLRWQSFLDLYIRNDASLEVNLTAELLSTAQSLEFNPAQLDSITNVLNSLLGGVLVNLKDTYSRFRRAFEAGAFIERKR